ncbi:ABC transporter permease [Amycolatopsis sp. Poz14]|uniref:ABC transporter permease n=1 Tax=Amycolatopsis sp. Poz14 TaxID=1447705 RepID=UPI001EE8DEFC|nr:ABC transporter permease [Amycolatopsis sp. Poz14]MCG3753164.1 ABC transporter permease [Amycolatopsis sp. Poz14]
MLSKLTVAEAKIFLRDPGAPAAVLGIPLALLLVFGLMPGSREPSAQYGGESPLATVIAPMAVALLLGMLAVYLLPAAMASHREKGVLKRLAASPMPPSRLLAAQLLVNLASAVVAIVLVVGVGTIALGMALPKNPGGFLAVTLLGAVSLFSMGTLLAAFVPSARAANGIGAAVFFPMLALGGVWVPKEQLSPVLQHIADVLPLGATLGSLRDTAAGHAPHLLPMVALAVFAIVCSTLAARFFRWE